jgi:hypothetical protein
MTEQQFTNELLAWGHKLGWRCFHVRNSGAGGNTQVQGDKGFPDLVMVRPPRLIIAELKIGKQGTYRGEPTIDQEVWLGLIDDLAMGIETYVWRPDQFEEIIIILRRKP